MRIQLVYVFILIAFVIILMAKDLGFQYALTLLAITFGAIALLDGTEMMEAGPSDATKSATGNTSGAAGSASTGSAAIDSTSELRNEDMPWNQPVPMMYSREAELNQGQTDTYNMCYQPVRPIVSSGADLDSSVDGLIALNTQKRGARDKKVFDAVALKDSDFYRYYVDDELRLNESRPWWGDAEY